MAKTKKRSKWQIEQEHTKALMKTLFGNKPSYGISNNPKYWLEEELQKAQADVLERFVRRHPTLTRAQIDAALELVGIEKWPRERLIRDLLEQLSGPIGKALATTTAKDPTKASTKKKAAKKTAKASTKKKTAKAPRAARTKKKTAKKTGRATRWTEAGLPAKGPAKPKAPKVVTLNAFDQRVLSIVREAIADGGRAGVSGIASEVGSSARKVGNSLAKLRDQGLVLERHPGSWEYVRLTDDRPIEAADVLSHLREHGSATAAELAATLGASSAESVVPALTKLERQNDVRRIRTGNGVLWSAQIELIRDDPPPAPKAGGRRPLADRVLELLEAGGMTTSAIRTELGCAGSRLKAALAKLVDQGRVAGSDLDGWTRVPEAAE